MNRRTHARYAGMVPFFRGMEELFELVLLDCILIDGHDCDIINDVLVDSRLLHPDLNRFPPSNPK